MTCENCGQAPAKFKITVPRGNAPIVQNVCPKCAAAITAGFSGVTAERLK